MEGIDKDKDNDKKAGGLKDKNDKTDKKDHVVNKKDKGKYDDKKKEKKSKCTVL